MTGPVEDRRSPSTLARVAVACLLLVVGATGASIVSSIQRADDLTDQRARDRERSCEFREAIVDAFGFYTDALVGASASSADELPPDKQAARAEQVAAFRAEVDERLSPIRCPQEALP